MPDVLSALAAAGSAGDDRSSAIDAVLSQAPVIGVERALAEFGRPLLETDRRLIASLSQEELRNLAGIRAKLGAIARAAADNNNNNFY